MIPPPDFPRSTPPAPVMPLPRDATPAVDVGALRERAETAERLLEQSESRTTGYFEAYHKLDIERARLAEEIELLRCDGIAAAMLRSDRDIARSERDAAIQAASGATVRADATQRLLDAERARAAGLDKMLVEAWDIIRALRGGETP